MFDNDRVCRLVSLFINVLYLVGLFFLVQFAKDAGIWVVACIAAAIVAVVFIRKCTTTLFEDGGLWNKIWGVLMIGIFAVGTILDVYLSLVWF